MTEEASFQGDQLLLVVEDDAHYARIMADLTHDHGMKCS